MKGLMLKVLIAGLVASFTTIIPGITLGEELKEEKSKKKEEVALEEVVVTATRTPTPAEEVGSSITVITGEEIEAKGQATVQEVLKGTPGLDVWATGGPGSQSSVSLRGAAPYHTLVLIDGLEVNDPTDPNRGFNFANLTVGNIERIEILRGPQSPLYGSDAIGGVINIITKKGKGKPKFHLGSEGGSYGTWRKFGGLTMGDERMNLSLGLSHISTDGFSAADDDLPGNNEDDRWENTTASARMGYSISENAQFEFTGRFFKGRTQLDSGGGPYSDQEDYHVNEQRIFSRTKLDLLLCDGLWEQTLAYGYANQKRDYRDHPWGDSDYDGEKHEISWQNNLYFHENSTLTFGFEYEREKMDDNQGIDKFIYTTSVFAQDQINLWDCYFLTLGVRWDDHEEFGSETTFRITQAFLLRDWGTKFKASYGTGFRAPSLYELYAPPFWGGNQNLDPEESKGFDIGIEQSLFDNRLTFGITYFYNDFDDLIDFTWTDGYLNINDAKTRGIESFIKIDPLEGLSLSLNYTYTDTEDDEGRRLLRRPLHKIGFNTFYKFHDRSKLNLHILYVGEKDDSYWDPTTFTSRRVVTDDYVVVNLSGSFDLSEHLQLIGRIDNLFDEDYYECYGYGTAGFSAYGGLKITF